MSNGSPSAYLLWAILSTIFFVFLLVHLWLYDGFKCIKWDSGRQPGAFRRVMTYSYLATVPLLIVFSIAMTNIKFQEGYFVVSKTYITPRPVQLWSPEHRHYLFPLNLILSIAWAFEMVTHLEELAFWLFLLHQGPEKRIWFESWEYQTWGVGSIFAVLGLPLTAVVSRHDIVRTQAWIFMVGSIAGTSTTIAFLYVLFRFPIFIQQVKQGGAAPDVVVRLTIFYNLNCIRVVFRFLFTIPLLMIGLDAFFPPYRIVLNPFALDFLLMMSAIGCFVSSAITLFVFFPRSMTKEAGYTTRISSPRQSKKVPTLPEYYHEYEVQDLSNVPERGPSHEHSTSGSKQFLSSSPAYHPGPGYHPASYGTPGAFVRSSSEVYHDEWTRRGSAELPSEAEETESSPVYQSDVDGLSSESLQSPRFQERQERQPQISCFHDAEDVSQGISDSTVLETQPDQPLPSAVGRPASLECALLTLGSFHGSVNASISPQSPSPALLRRYSDAPFDPKNSRAALPHRLSNQDEIRPSRSESQKRPHRTRGSSGTVIHPYLMNFTSPIDLLDTSPSEVHLTQMV